MGNYRIAFSGVLSHGAQNFVTGITDLQIVTGGGDPLLVSTTRAGGGMAAFNATTGALVRTEATSPDLMQLIPPDLAILQAGGQTYLATLGLAGATLPAVPILPSGALGALTGLGAPGQDLGQITGLVQASFGGSPYAYASVAGAGLMRLEPRGGALLDAQPLALTGAGERHRVSDLVSVTAGGQDYIVTSHATADTIASFRLGAGGALQRVSEYGAAQGLGIDAPTALVPVSVGGTSYVVAASTLSSSLSVFELGPNGILNPVDHVIDSLDTRFQRVTALDAVTIGDRNFILAGGGDDGISLFLLLPGGRLLHLDSMADSLNTTLANVSNVEGLNAGGSLRIFATSESEAGITALSVDVSNRGQTLIGGAAASQINGTAQDDILAGGAGAETLNGGTGNDILMDGAGSDRMTAGPGADRFILAADDAPDVITDFQPGEDQLDLSAWIGLTSPDQLRIETRSWGAELGFRSETLELRSASGGGLSRSEVLWAPVLNITRTPVGSLPDAAGGDPAPPAPVPPSAPGLSRTGGAGNDSLTGGIGNDTLVGAGGDDMLTGAAGQDRLLGSDGNDRLFGGTGDDWLSGGTGNDTLNGGDGDDTLIGWTGADLMDGGQGSDLYMVDALDRLQDSGTTGIDRAQIYQDTGVALNIGQWTGIERVHGLSGNDTLDATGLNTPVFLFGERGNDLLRGGTGHDTLIGGPGNDTLTGGAGNDWLSGGAGADHFVFRPGFGRDVIASFDHGDDRIVFSEQPAPLAFADLQITQFHSDTVIRTSPGSLDLVILADFDALRLTADDFLF